MMRNKVVWVFWSDTYKVRPLGNFELTKVVSLLDIKKQYQKEIKSKLLSSIVVNYLKYKIKELDEMIQNG